MVEFINNRTMLLRDALKLHLSESREVIFALAFIRQSGVNMIVHDISAVIRRGGNVKILFANDFGATEAESITSLQEIGANLRFYSKPNTSFHLKVYIFKKANSAVAIIGSSNLSDRGLTSGIEWSICINSDEIDFSYMLSEFQLLWDSEHATKITSETIHHLETQTRSQDLMIAIHEEDRYPIPEPFLHIQAVINDPHNYVVKRNPNNEPLWFFQIYEGQLTEHSKQGAFNVVVVCNYMTSDQVVFSIPYSFLQENILPFAHLEENRRYLFNIDKATYKFLWNRAIKMDGLKFLIK